MNFYSFLKLSCIISVNVNGKLYSELGGGVF